jgi:chitin disaccharide deacetylase
MTWDFEPMPASGQKRYLILNADDFGQSPGVNRGIIEAHERGIVTSASLMVRWPAAGEAAAYGLEHPDLSLGLHFDFWEWTCRRRTWAPLYQVVPEDDVEAVAHEASRQMAAFRRLVGRDPTHIDSHQHAHRKDPLSQIFLELASRLGVPLRGFSSKIGYCGAFYGQSDDGRPWPRGISVKGLIEVVAKLRPGFTELGCHPGYAEDLNSMYRRERQREIETLCDPRVRAAITDMGIAVCSFRDMAIAHNGGQHH